MTDPTPRALTFDVFGTVVDWRSSVIRQLREFGARHGVETDWKSFADDWRYDGYIGGMQKVRAGQLPFQTAGSLHRRKLDALLAERGITGIPESEVAELNLAWHRLDPWPDSVEGLKRLKSKFIIATLSNGNTSLLVNMAKHGGLPWDCVFSSDTFKLFKPDPGMYLGAASMLDLTPDAVMMVAAHKPDLRAAAKCELKTAFVKRPLEHGREATLDLASEPDFTVNAGSFLGLADQLGC